MFSRFSVALLIVFLAFLFSFQAHAQLISYEKYEQFTTEQLAEKWKKYGIPKMISPIKYDVDIYEIIYETQWYEGKRVKASGLYFVPKDLKEPMPFLIYNHGTSTRKERHLGFNGEETIAFMFSADGYGVGMTDYVGLGKGEGVHLYIHAESEANASIDLMKAIDQVNKELGYSRNDKLFISGYSQGGHAAMATHKMLQEKYSDQYTVTASSPMSGPYDVSKTQATVMFAEYSQPHYLPYLLIGYNAAYKVFPEEHFYEIFADHLQDEIPTLFTSGLSHREINGALPKVPMHMLQDELVEEFRSGKNERIQFVLEDNDVYQWKPEAPMQLCYCKGDEEVKWENAIVAQRYMKEQGAKNITTRHVAKKMNHRQCADFAVIYTKYYFDTFLKGGQSGRKGKPFKRGLLGLAKMFR